MERERVCKNCSYHKVYLDYDDNPNYCKCTYDIKVLDVGHYKSCEIFDGELSDCPYCDEEGEEIFNYDDDM